MIKKQILKNFLSAWLAKLIKLASAIYMVPVFISHMGKDAYGLIILLTTILSFSTLADIGIRAGVTRYMTKAIAVKDNHEFNTIFNTGLGIYLMIWLVLAMSLFLSSGLLIDVFNIPSQYSSECIFLLRTYGILTLFWSFTTPLFGAISSASNRYDLSNYRESIISTCSMVVLIVAIQLFDIGVMGWAVITVVTQIVTAIAMIRVAYYLAPYLKVNLSYFDKSRVKELVQFGGIMLIGGWSRRMKIDADPLLISSILGPGPIAMYRSGVAIPSHSRVLLGSFTGQISSVSTNLHAVGDQERFKQLFERGTKLTILMGIPVVVCLVVFAFDIINLWLGRTFSASELADASRCLQGMALVDFCFYLEGSSYAVLYAMNKLKFMTFTDLFIGITNILSSYLILKYSGLGVWCVIIPTIVLEGIARPFYLYYTANQIGYNSALIMKRIYLPSLYVLVPTLLMACACSIYLPMGGFVKLLIECLLTGLLYAVLLWYVGFEETDRKDMLSIVFKKK